MEFPNLFTISFLSGACIYLSVVVVQTWNASVHRTWQHYARKDPPTHSDCHLSRIKSSNHRVWRGAFSSRRENERSLWTLSVRLGQGCTWDDGRFGHGDGYAHGTCMLQHVASWGSWERDFASQQGRGLGDQSKDALCIPFYSHGWTFHSIPGIQCFPCLLVFTFLLTLSYLHI